MAGSLTENLKLAYLSFKKEKVYSFTFYLSPPTPPHKSNANRNSRPLELYVHRLLSGTHLLPVLVPYTLSPRLQVYFSMCPTLYKAHGFRLPPLLLTTLRPHWITDFELQLFSLFTFLLFPC